MTSVQGGKPLKNRNRLGLSRVSSDPLGPSAKAATSQTRRFDDGQNAMAGRKSASRGGVRGALSLQQNVSQISDPGFERGKHGRRSLPLPATSRSGRPKSETTARAKQQVRLFVVARSAQLCKKWKEARAVAMWQLGLEQIEEKSANEGAVLGREPPLSVWRRIAKIVRLLCAVCIALRKYAMDAGLMDNYIVSVTTRRSHKEGRGDEVEEISFNLDEFKIDRELKMPKTLVEVMGKRPDDRTPEEIQAIGRLMRNLPSFKKYTRDMQDMMGKIVRYMKCGKRRVILRKGHVGLSVYFVYSGSVSVVLDKDDQSIFVRREVVLLKKGACFGEIALVQNTRRNATVVCAEDCEFLVIDKEDYVANGLHIQNEEEYKQRYNFYRSWEPLATWTDSMVQDLSYVSRTEDFNHNKVVISDSRRNEWLWFIISGSCDVLRFVNLEEQPNYPKLVSVQSACRFVTFPADSKQYRARSAPLGPRRSRAPSRCRPRTSSGMASRENDLVKKNHYSKSQTIQYVNGAVHNVQNGTPQKKQSDSLACNVDGIYVKVDTLRDGQCFGLETLRLDPTEQLSGPKYSMISKGCTLIHVPKSKFKEMVSGEIWPGIKRLLKKYPSDKELCEQFLAKREWDSFKHDVVENVVAEHLNNATFENSLRHAYSEDYVKRRQLCYESSRFYAPVTCDTHSTLVGSYKDPTQGGRQPRVKSSPGSRRPKTANCSVNGDPKRGQGNTSQNARPPSGSFAIFQDKKDEWEGKLHHYADYMTQHSRKQVSTKETPLFGQNSTAGGINSRELVAQPWLNPSYTVQGSNTGIACHNGHDRLSSTYNNTVSRGK